MDRLRGRFVPLYNYTRPPYEEPTGLCHCRVIVDMYNLGIYLSERLFL